MSGSKRSFLLIGGGLLLFASLITATAELYTLFDPVTVPDETSLCVTLDQAVSSDQSRPGDQFAATVSKPVVVGDKTVISPGTHVVGLVVDSEPSGRMIGRARLQLALESIDLDGKSYELHAETSVRSGGNHKNWTGKKDIHLGPETSLTFRLAQPLTIDGKV